MLQLSSRSNIEIPFLLSMLCCCCLFCQIGRVNSLRAGDDDRKTLAGCRFVTGDLLDISIAAPNLH